LNPDNDFVARHVAPGENPKHVEDFTGLWAKYTCEYLNAVDEKVEEYIYSIWENEDKKLVEMEHSVGEKLCRGFFGNCKTEESFYTQYRKACTDGWNKALEETRKKDVENGQKTLPQKTDALLKGLTGSCEELVKKKLKADKKTAHEIVAHNQKQITETNSNKYLKKAHDLFQKVSDLMNNFLVKFGAIARSFEAFQTTAYGG
jgi:vacuolar-type H+-ATPase subunit H